MSSKGMSGAGKAAAMIRLDRLEQWLHVSTNEVKRRRVKSQRGVYPWYTSGPFSVRLFLQRRPKTPILDTSHPFNPILHNYAD
jgi:hypothetical protein